MYLFKTPDKKHLTAKKLKTGTAHEPTETVREYDKICKELLSQLEYNIDEQLLIQWFVARLLHKIQMHVRIDNFNTYEDALIKSLHI